MDRLWLLVLLVGVETRIFNASDYGAVGDGVTDNTAAFSACLDAVVSANGGTMVLAAGSYMGRVIIPPVQGKGFITLEIVGLGGEPAPVFGTVGTQQLSEGGTILQSNSSSGVPVIFVTAVDGGFSSVYVVLKNVEVRTYDDPGIGGVDFGMAQQCKLENVFINTGVYDVQASQPTHGTAGLITPAINNGAWTVLRNVIVTGYALGIVANEHTDGDSIVVAANIHGLSFSQANHASRFARVGAYRNSHHVTVTGAHGFSIAQLAIEKAGPGQTTPQNAWQATLFDINDPSNQGVADITYWVVVGNVGPSSNFTVNGAASILARRIGTPATCNA